MVGEGQIWRARSASLYRGSGAMPPVGSTGRGVRGGVRPSEANAILAFWDCICELILTFDS